MAWGVMSFKDYLTVSIKCNFVYIAKGKKRRLSVDDFEKFWRFLEIDCETNLPVKIHTEILDKP